MRVVVALGGNALLKRGEPMTAENQRANVRAAAPALAAVAKEHELVLSHGNGPQVGLLALQAAAYTEVEPYPLDVLGAQTEGMIGYVLEQELGNVMPPRRAARDDPDDGRGRPGRPGVRGPDQVRRPDLHQGRGRRAARREGLGVQAGRRQLAPGRAVARAAAHLRDPTRSAGCSTTTSCVICAGGGGVPDDVPRRRPSTTLVGVEAVIDKDLASELLAREVAADLFVMATDVDAVYADWGTPQQRALGRVTAAELRAARVPGRLDGAEGRGGVPLRRGDREARRDRRARRRSSRSSTERRAPRSCP